MNGETRQPEARDIHFFNRPAIDLSKKLSYLIFNPDLTSSSFNAFVNGKTIATSLDNSALLNFSFRSISSTRSEKKRSVHVDVTHSLSSKRIKYNLVPSAAIPSKMHQCVVAEPQNNEILRESASPDVIADPISDLNFVTELPIDSHSLTSQSFSFECNINDLVQQVSNVANNYFNVHGPELNNESINFFNIIPQDCCQKDAARLFFVSYLVKSKACLAYLLKRNRTGRLI